MSMELLAWAWSRAESPTGDLRHGHGSWYRPIAKLLMVAMADRADQGDGRPAGSFSDFPALCEQLWMTPQLGTMVLQHLEYDGLVELDVTWGGRPGEYYPRGLALGFSYVLRGTNG
jgi:hypothetical protein